MKNRKCKFTAQQTEYNALRDGDAKRCLADASREYAKLTYQQKRVKSADERLICSVENNSWRNGDLRCAADND